MAWRGARWCCAGKRETAPRHNPVITLGVDLEIRIPQGCGWDVNLCYPISIASEAGMSDKTLTRMELSEAVCREVGLSKIESAQLVEAVLQHMSDALVAGEPVKISSFGTFSVRDKNARVGRNPKTGDEVPIEPRRVLSFRPSHLMKDRVAKGNQD